MTVIGLIMQAFIQFGIAINNQIRYSRDPFPFSAGVYIILLLIAELFPSIGLISSAFITARDSTTPTTSTNTQGAVLSTASTTLHIKSREATTDVDEDDEKL
jgi:hypothetical protein